MEDALAPQFDVRSLGELTQLGKGGQGCVYAVDGFRINQQWPVVYKEYDPVVRSRLDVAQLRRMVSFVPTLDPATGRWLCEQSAWPAALVTCGPVVCGLLMRRIPADFEICLPAGGGTVRRPAGFQFLLNSDTYLARMAIPVDDRGRLLLLADLARSLSRLHRLGAVVGDLSPNNLLFRLGDRPGCFFIDCDAMRLAGGSALPQTETPDWEVPLPDGEPLATPATDAYKFGLLAARLFARDQSSRDTSALAAVSDDLAHLAEASLSVVPVRRPTPQDWITALTSAAAGDRLDGRPVVVGVGSGSGPEDGPAVVSTTSEPGNVGRTLVLLVMLGILIVYLVNRFG
ncbi:hypothetical protein [Micromonospora auratinigra]|uniref:Protein kinase domain-containing protein n=1 Tax=Micromonospora auratinigra TaxID=261654 RepID=A0A1A8ZQN0_9ACTN|nr:hypothetical protein [Micromonospora auratinigra]SBT46186.1 hypothetical protein GA0070611_3294 [Micromonospora auratinigra]